MPLSMLVPFALVAVIGIVVFYAAYRAGAWGSATIICGVVALCVPMGELLGRRLCCLSRRSKQDQQNQTLNQHDCRHPSDGKH